MDGPRFDDLTRRIVRNGTRRRVVGGFVGVLLGAVRIDLAQAAACRPTGSVCREHANCCTRFCGPKNATGRRTCSCEDATQCPTPPVCHTAQCTTDGLCVTENAADGTVCTVGGETGQCTNGACLLCLPVGASCTVGGSECCGGCQGFGDPGTAGTCIAAGSIPDGGRCSFGGTNYDDVCASGRCEQRSAGQRFCCSRDTGNTCSVSAVCCNASFPTGTVDCCSNTCTEIDGCDPDDVFGDCGCTG